MREIKFRGISSKTNDWAYGYLEKHENAFGEHYYAIGDGINNIQRIDENTIGQFTGLHDKNGKEIYEGDILEAFYIREKDYVVKFGEYHNEEQWEDMRCGYGWYIQSLDETPSSIRELNYELCENKVIGNIHEVSK